ncbi:MAG: hypothetical protein WBG65_00430 [Sulfurimonadaceae bacterium]
MLGWFKKEDKTNKEIAIDKFKKAGLTFEEADYLAQDVAELNLYADNNLFHGNEDNVHSLEEAYKDKYYMSTVDTISNGSLPIKDIAYTGIQARAWGLNFEARTAIKKSVFEYLERNGLDNTHFKEAFMQTLNTVQGEEHKEDISPLINLLYTKGWILSESTKEYDESISRMVDQLGVEQSLDNFQNLLLEGAGWYKQVNNPKSQLQKITSLSLNWLGGKLYDIKNDMLLQDLAPFDILINTRTYQEQVYNALNEAAQLEDFPKMEDGYRDEVAGRFLQYMQEEIRLNILNSRSIEDMQHIIDRLNKAELDYLDIENIYPDSSMGDTRLTLKMGNEENFSLVFDNTENMQMALDLINYKRHIFPTNEREKYFETMDLDKLLIDFEKMSFENFINQYELDREQIESIYRWKDENYEKGREEKIVNFSGYSLRFMNVGKNLVAIFIHQTEEEIAEEERRKEEIQKDMDEIPF